MENKNKFHYVPKKTTNAPMNGSFTSQNSSSRTEKHQKISPPKFAIDSEKHFVHDKLRQKYVVHCKRSPYDVYVGRKNPQISNSDFKWGNPFKNQDESKYDRVLQFQEWILSKPELIEMAKKELKGKVLACWCAPECCHAEILCKIANEEEEKELMDSIKK
jgi:hypothetical protein